MATDDIPETPSPNRIEEKAVIDPTERQELMDETLEATIIQNLVSAKMFAELVVDTSPNNTLNRERNMKIVQEEIDTAFRKMRLFQEVLRRNPNLPLPIDYGFIGTGTGKPVIALDKLTELKTDE